jgi:hypothetical protein
MKRLLLMSGIHHPEGWTTLDANPANKPDIVATIPPLPPDVWLTKWDEIEWVHGITSLYPWDGERVLKELYWAVQRPDGVLVLEQCDYHHAHWTIPHVFGDPEHREPLHMNRWAYTPDSLTEAVKAAGFTRVEILPAQHHVPSRDFRLEARP